MASCFHIKYYKNMAIGHDIGGPFSSHSTTFSTRIFQELLKVSWYISVTADSNCICTVTAIRSPSSRQTCPWISYGEDSGPG